MNVCKEAMDGGCIALHAVWYKISPHMLVLLQNYPIFKFRKELRGCLGPFTLSIFSNFYFYKSCMFLLKIILKLGISKNKTEKYSLFHFKNTTKHLLYFCSSCFKIIVCVCV